jgi:hypothetical protein
MIAGDHLTDEQFERHALDLLMRELGPDGLARFLRLNRDGTGATLTSSTSSSTRQPSPASSAAFQALSIRTCRVRRLQS